MAVFDMIYVMICTDFKQLFVPFSIQIAGICFNPHFAVQNGNGFNPDVELLRVCETFSFLDKLSKPLAVLSRSEAGFFH